MMEWDLLFSFGSFVETVGASSPLSSYISQVKRKSNFQSPFCWRLPLPKTNSSALKIGLLTQKERRNSPKHPFFFRGYIIYIYISCPECI